MKRVILRHVVSRPCGRGVRGTRVDDPARGCLDALRRRAASEAALETTLALERSTSAFALARAETKVHDERLTRRLVADATNALVLEVDRDGIVRSCSPASSGCCGYTAAELNGREVYSLMHSDHLLSPAGGPQRYARKDGSYVSSKARA